jgi:histidinol-phosphate aminotransferase
MKVRFKPWIKNLPEYVAGRTIEEIKEKYGLSEVHKLASNENIMGASPVVRKFIEDYRYDFNYYPDSNCTEIRLKIAEKFSLSPDNIIVGSGTDQIIEMICDCVIDKTDNIVIADPNFLIYEKATLKCGGSVVKVPLKDFRQDIKSIIKSVNENTRIVFIASPHNPSGTIVHKEEFEELLSKIPGDILMVIDEAYYDYLSEQDKLDTLGYVRDFSNLISLRTFSKIYGLAGLRIGYGIADHDIISNLNKIRLPFNVSSIAQKTAVFALENDGNIKKVRSEIIREKQKFYNILNKEGISYIRSYANFILIKTGDIELEVVEELLSKGFIVRPGINLGTPGYIRVTISVPDINDIFLSEFIKTYKKAIC